MKGQRAGFCAGIVNHFGEGAIGRRGGDCHDHTVIGGDHVREEFAHETEVGEDVHGEGFVDGSVGTIQNGLPYTYSSIIYQNCGVAKGRAYL